MIVNATQDYTITGNGLITGSMSLDQIRQWQPDPQYHQRLQRRHHHERRHAHARRRRRPRRRRASPSTAAPSPSTPPAVPPPITTPSPSPLPSRSLTPGTGNNNQAFGGALTGSANLFINTGSGGTFSARGSVERLHAARSSSPARETSVSKAATGSAATQFDLGTNNAVMFARDGGTITLGSLTGGPNTFLRGAGSTAASTTYLIGGNNLSTTFAGTITNGNVSGVTEATAITKTGTGTLTLTGANNYTGNTTVSNGLLVINGNNGPSPDHRRQRRHARWHRPHRRSRHRQHRCQIRASQQHHARQRPHVERRHRPLRPFQQHDPRQQRPHHAHRRRADSHRHINHHAQSAERHASRTAPTPSSPAALPFPAPPPISSSAAAPVDARLSPSTPPHLPAASFSMSAALRPPLSFGKARTAIIGTPSPPTGCSPLPPINFLISIPSRLTTRPPMAMSPSSGLSNPASPLSPTTRSLTPLPAAKSVAPPNSSKAVPLP